MEVAAPIVRRNIRDRDTDALIRALIPMIRHTAQRYFIAGGDYDDLIQEGRIGAYKAVRDYRGSDDPDQFSAFARLVITRNIITAVKTATRNKHEPLNTALDIDSPPPGNDHDDRPDGIARVLPLFAEDPVERLIAREEGYRLLDIIRWELSEMERTVFLAVEACGYSYGEVRELTGLPIKTIDNARQRAARKIEGRPARKVRSASPEPEDVKVEVQCECGVRFERRHKGEVKCPACRELGGHPGSREHATATAGPPPRAARMFSREARAAADRKANAARSGPVESRFDPSIIRRQEEPPVPEPEPPPVDDTPPLLDQLRREAEGLAHLSDRERGERRGDLVVKYLRAFGARSHLRMAADLKLSRSHVEQTVRRLARGDAPLVRKTGRNVFDFPRERTGGGGRSATEWELVPAISKPPPGVDDIQGGASADRAVEEPEHEGEQAGEARVGFGTVPNVEGYIDALFYRIRHVENCSMDVFNRAERLLGITGDDTRG